MQYQKTIFGTEVECKQTTPTEEQVLGMIVDMSERTSLPVYLPSNGKGKWYMSIDGKAYAVAPGNSMGLTGSWLFICDNPMAKSIMGVGFSQMVGTCLMDGKAIKVVETGVDYLSIVAFGVLGDTSKNPLKFYRVNGEWTK